MVNHRPKLLLTAFILFTLTMGVANVYSGRRQEPVHLDAAEPEPLIVSNDARIISPDGKMSLNVNETKTDTENIYKFTINGITVFNSTLPPDSKVIVPFNTFSPDNKYFFLEVVSEEKIDYIVLTSDGKSYSVNTPELEISSLFNSKYPDFKITEITGWASPTLIVINADKTSGGQGPSFWFDVTTKSFYRLSTRFN